MRTPEEIKKTLECCAKYYQCNRCPYRGDLCLINSTGDALAYIERLEIIGNTPIADMVRVIRCKECANYRPSPFGHPTIGWCKMDGKHRGQDFYCANGERKKQEE